MSVLHLNRISAGESSILFLHEVVFSPFHQMVYFFGFEKTRQMFEREREMCNIIIVTKIESVRLTTIIEWLKIELDSSKKK